MTDTFLKDFINISPGFKAAVNLKIDRDNLGKVAGYIPTQKAGEIILDFAKKLHPTSDKRSRLITGTYGTGKSHLALVLLNFFLHPIDLPELEIIVEKLDYDDQSIVKEFKNQVTDKFLPVIIYGDEGNMSDALIIGLKKALESKGLESLLPESAFGAALERINDLEANYPDGYKIFESELQNKKITIDELRKRLENYEKQAFDIFRTIHPKFSHGGNFEYTTMLSPNEFYKNVAEELRKNHNYSGIAVFWDEFGHKMNEIVKDPSSSEGLVLQEFAECCNSSGENQLHLYLFCHKSLKEYHETVTSIFSSNKHLEDDFRKIEGRFKHYVMTSTDVETFQLIDAVISANTRTEDWTSFRSQFDNYFKNLVHKTSDEIKLFTGFSKEQISNIVVIGTYPLHPMAVFCLPSISEKVAQNNRTLFTCLCEDEPNTFKRFVENSFFTEENLYPPMFTVDMLWDYFADDVKKEERTNKHYLNFNKLLTNISDGNEIEKKILKAVSIFNIIESPKIKVTDKILAYSLDIQETQLNDFYAKLTHCSDFKNPDHILMKLESDGSYKLAVTSSSESLQEKIKKLVNESPEKFGQSPIQYLNSNFNQFSPVKYYDAKDYFDKFGVERTLEIKPVSINQLRDNLHLLTKDIGNNAYIDGVMLSVICINSNEIEEAKIIASDVLSDDQYKQVILAIPKKPVQIMDELRKHQALSYFKKHEPNLYGVGGELEPEWKVWNDDTTKIIEENIKELFTPENEMLEFYWKGELRKISNLRQLKKFISETMYNIFSSSAFIGDTKLAEDDFKGNWGYRKECKDIILKLTKGDAAFTLWNESAASQKQVIEMILKQNGILKKNQAGDFVIEKPDEENYPGSFAVWECIEGFINNAKKHPVEMKNIVRKLRRPPFGLKCRVMPLFFAAVAHKYFVLGNITFELKKSNNKIETITSIENDTLEKVFITPESYTLVYRDVSSNQKAVINGLSKVFETEIFSHDTPLETVKKVGNSIGQWWRSLPKHSQISDQISDDAKLFKSTIFKPLAQLEPDLEKILLKDIFEYVFDIDEKVKVKDVELVTNPVKEEFEKFIEKLYKKIENQFDNVFGQSEEPGESLLEWFNKLPGEKKDYVYAGNSEILMNVCRSSEKLTLDDLLKLASNLTGLDVKSWSDEMIIRFQGQLEFIKNHVESFEIEPASLPKGKIEETSENFKEEKGALLVNLTGKTQKIYFDKLEQTSPNAEILHNMLDSTINQLCKGMSHNEKIMVLCKIVEKHIFGEQSND